MLRQLIRWIATSLVSIGMIVAVEPVIHVNVEHLAKQRHWDEFFAKWWPEVPDLSPLLQTRWFWLCFGSSLGVALALWIVRLFPERRPQVNVTAPAAVLPSDPQIAPSPIAGGAWFPAEPPAMTEYDRDRRRREIDELIASITAGNTLKSLRDAGAFALLLQSGICPRRSTQELADEITNVRNSMVNADNERITIASKFPENLDILDIIECKDWTMGMGSSPRDLAGLLALHPYIMTNLNIPSDALNNVPTWIFFKDTIKVNELNEWLQRYIAWCEEVHSALIERRRALA